MASSTGDQNPKIDASLQRSSFLHPTGVVARVSPAVLDYYSSATANSSGSGFEPTMRSRSLSNATMELVDMRHSMTRSLTDLFERFEIKDPGDVVFAIPLLIHTCTDLALTAFVFRNRISARDSPLRINESPRRRRFCGPL